jgi:hypothetical protein
MTALSEGGIRELIDALIAIYQPPPGYEMHIASQEKLTEVNVVSERF